MKLMIYVCLASLLLPPVMNAQQKLPTATPMLSPSICGKAVYDLWLGDQSVGREEFEIKCRPDGGYQASGHTELKPTGAVIDLSTTLEVDKSGEPLSSTAKGTINGSPFDQSVVVKGSTTTITTGASTKELPFAKGSSLVGGNIFYMNQFLLARYDAARGGVQELPIFPNLTAKVERVARDEVQATGISAQPAPLVFDRYSVTIAISNVIAWVDSKGRLAVLAVPLQNFAAVRQDCATLIPSFKAILSAKMKESELDYKAPAGAPFTAEDVTVEAKGFKLAGTLLTPTTGKPPYPAVVTITGSGQQTRDEYLPLAGLEKYRPFRQIAEALASRGIAVLRVDDRGVGQSGGRETLTVSTSANFADDVRAQVDFLRERREIDPARIGLIGHSEGGIIAPMVAASDPRVAAIVLLAGTAKRGDVIIAYQVDQGLTGDITLTDEERAKKHAEQQEAMRKAIAGDATAPESLKSAWVKYFLTYDPLPTIRKVRQPILILQGEIDRQVTADQAEMLAKAARDAGNRDVTERVFPGLNHLFLPAKTGSPSEYSSLSTNSIPDDVMKQLVDWFALKLKVK
ncbi:MAG TPA: alpha/beta fold hydrolase [Blastocatellia bacterium]|nr:alpha/beta fold hydrolase [Blastocatellia bacterium]